jgi:hypothetical protein
VSSLDNRAVTRADGVEIVSFQANGFSVLSTFFDIFLCSDDTLIMMNRWKTKRML